MWTQTLCSVSAFFVVSDESDEERAVEDAITDLSGSEVSYHGNWPSVWNFSLSWAIMLT